MTLGQRRRYHGLASMGAVITTSRLAPERQRRRDGREGPQMTNLTSEFELVCPCCSASLVIDVGLKRVVRHSEPERQDKVELGEADRILTEEAARREAVFQQSVADERTRSDALGKRFEEALRKATDEPVTRPERDFDLD